jgi:hypothetical protein
LIFIYLLFNLTQVQDAVAVSGGEFVVRRYRQSRSAYRLMLEQKTRQNAENEISVAVKPKKV